METTLSKTDTSVLSVSDSVEKYIIDTLLFTPQHHVKNERWVEIKVYAPDESQPSMKIFRMIFRLQAFIGQSKDLKEISFQDEVSLRDEDGGMDLNVRHQINFSIFVEKDTYRFHSIKDRPATITRTLGSIQVFETLSKKRGAALYVGSHCFESDGNGWVDTAAVSGIEQ
jgi:hypothetical protein